MARTKHQLFNEEIDDAVYETGAKHLSRTLPISSLTLDPEFESMFPLDKEGEKGIEQIAENIKLNGYDDSQPIHAWVHEEDGKTIYTPIDGHRRRQAALLAGLKDIPVFEHHFKDRNEALLYAMGLQIDRRNLNDSELLSAVTTYMKLGGTRKQGNIKEVLAARTGLSERTVAKAMVVAKSTKAVNDVKKGKSVNEVYQQLKSKKTKKGIEKNIDEKSESMPQPLNFNYSDGIERPQQSTDDNTAYVSLEEKNLQCKEAREEGFSDGFWKGLVFALSEVEKGRRPNEVYNDERISDLSPQIICNFVLPEDAEDIVRRF